MKKSLRILPANRFLGAQPADVLRMILRESLALVLAGSAIGALGVYFGTWLIASFLFDVKPDDPLTITGAIVVMALVASVAAFLPANRASRVNPLVALRHE